MRRMCSQAGCATIGDVVAIRALPLVLHLLRQLPFPLYIRTKVHAVRLIYLIWSILRSNNEINVPAYKASAATTNEFM